MTISWKNKFINEMTNNCWQIMTNMKRETKTNMTRETGANMKRVCIYPKKLMLPLKHNIIFCNQVTQFTTMIFILYFTGNSFTYFKREKKCVIHPFWHRSYQGNIAKKKLAHLDESNSCACSTEHL